MLKNNKVTFIFALIISIVLWAYVLGGLNPMTTSIERNIPIKFENLSSLEDEGLTVLSISNESVNISVQGQRSVIGQLTPGSFRVVADLDGLEEGTNEVRIRAITSENIDINSISPLKITVVVDKLVTRGKNVKIINDGERFDEKTVHLVNQSMDIVNVTGPKTYVDQVSQVEAHFDVNEATNTTKSTSLELVPVDKDGVKVEGVKLQSDKVSVTTILHDTKELTIVVPTIGAETAGYIREIQYTKTVLVEGLGSVLDSVEYLTAEPLNLSGITEDCELEFKINLPNGLNFVDDSVDFKVYVTVTTVDTPPIDDGENGDDNDHGQDDDSQDDPSTGDKADEGDDVIDNTEGDNSNSDDSLDNSDEDNNESDNVSE